MEITWESIILALILTKKEMVCYENLFEIYGEAILLEGL